MKPRSVDVVCIADGHMAVCGRKRGEFFFKSVHQAWLIAETRGSLLTICPECAERVSKALLKGARRGGDEHV